MMIARSGAPDGAADGEALPRDIAFLAPDRVAPETLRQAARVARDAGVTAAAALLAEGLCPADVYFRALADALGAPYLPAPTKPAPIADPMAAIASGRIDLLVGDGGPTLALAPAGDAIAALLDGGVPPGAALTTPEALREAVFAASGADIAREAAHGLPMRRPDLSYRGGVRPWQKGAIAVAVALLAGLAATVEGAVAYAALLAGIVFLAVSGLRLIACLERAPVAARPPARVPDSELPTYTILAPLHREAAVVPDLCAALMGLDYPLAKLDIKLVVEETDEATAAAIRGLRLPGAFELVVAPAGEPRTKPRALNVALPLARGELLVIYDAEDAPEPGQLRLAATTFGRAGPQVACLQARLSIDNADENWLTAWFAVEYAALFDVVNPGLVRLGLPLPLGGTSNHFRTAALRAVDGWDAWNVTEDADLGLRLAALGLETRDLPSTTWEEAPTRLGVWVRQRSRWMKGYLQTLLTHTRDPAGAFARLGPARTLATWLLVGGTVGAALLYPLSVLVLATTLLGLPLAGLDLAPDGMGRDALTLATATLAATTCGAGLLIAWAVALEGVKRRRRPDLLVAVVTLPVYFVLVSFGAWLGLFELIRRPSHWHKTTHGLARGRAGRGVPGGEVFVAEAEARAGVSAPARSL